jgi:hypothetical protein
MMRATCLLPLTPLVLLASCGAPSVDATARYAMLGLDGDIRTDTSVGAATNSWDDLGLDDEEGTPGATVNLKWGMPHLSISTQGSSFSGTGIIESEIDLDGEIIGVGAQVDSDVDLGVTSALLTWDLVPGDFEFGLGLGLVALDLDMKFLDDVTGTTATTDETLPVPVLAARVGLSAGSWEAAGTLAGLEIDVEGDTVSFFDLDAYGKYHFMGGEDRLGASFVFGYRDTNLDLDYEDGPDEVDVELGISGPYIGLRLSF